MARNRMVMVAALSLPGGAVIATAAVALAAALPSSHGTGPVTHETLPAAVARPAFSFHR